MEFFHGDLPNHFSNVAIVRMFSHVDLEKLMMDKSQHNNPYSPCRGMT